MELPVRNHGREVLPELQMINLVPLVRSSGMAQGWLYPANARVR